VAHEIIRSKDNAALKRARAIGAGREDGLLLEGERLVRDALASGHALDFALVAESRAELADEWRRAGLDARIVADALLEQASRLRAPPGCIAVAALPAGRTPRELAELPGLLLAVAGVADPGNLGALARTAEAAGVVGLAIATGGCSPWNEKALRGSMGSLLRVPVALAPVAELARAFDAAGRDAVRAATRGGGPYDEHRWSAKSVLWLAAETGALPPELERARAVTIPMARGVESLNVAAAGAVLLFEAARRARTAR
jgi:TrmH family RNA methyltransferase